MKVLGVESSGMIGGVALVDDDRVVAQRIFGKGMVHGREIAPAVQDICQEAGTDLAEINLVAVDVGPGSYTGLRVGLAAGKALAYVLGCAIIGVRSLDALAEDAGAPEGATICAAIGARWGQVYGALYHAGAPPKLIGEILVEPSETFLQRAPEGAIAVGNAMETVNPDHRHPKPAVVARVGARDHAAGRRDDVRTLVPFYLSPTEAELNLSQKIT